MSPAANSPQKETSRDPAPPFTISEDQLMCLLQKSHCGTTGGGGVQQRNSQQVNTEVLKVNRDSLKVQKQHVVKPGRKRHDFPESVSC